MQATLVIVTLLSLALAIGMAILAWRLLRQERERAEARVAALEEGLAASLATNPPAAAQSIGQRRAAFGAREQAAGRARLHAAVAAAATVPSTASVLGLASADGGGGRAEIVELHSAGDPDWLAQFPSTSTKTSGVHHNGTAMNGSGAGSHLNGHGGAFAADRLVSDAGADGLAASDAMGLAHARSRGMLAIGVAGGAIVLLILALWSVGRLMAPGVGADSRGGGPTRASAIAAAAAPLELVALEQTRAGDQLTIHGTVRNPPAGLMIDRLAVVVAFFDVSGQQLASVRAPLDFRTLAPGDESPFQVTTSVPAGVTRYRVSFRRDEGTIVPHVDRRQQEAS